MAFHSSCADAQSTLPRVLGDAAVSDAARLDYIASDVGTSPNQAHAVTRALRFFRDVDAKQRHDALIMTRFDLSLRQSISRWSCDPTDPSRVALTSQCKPSKGPGWNCTNDLLHIVPRRHLPAFLGTVGAPRTPAAGGSASGCCFHPSCVKAGGHGCFNALVRRGVPPSDVRYCFPQSTSLVSVLQPNAFFELSQCADLPSGSAAQRPSYKGLDGTYRTGCDRGINRTAR